MTAPRRAEGPRRPRGAKSPAVSNPTVNSPSAAHHAPAGASPRDENPAMAYSVDYALPASHHQIDGGGQQGRGRYVAGPAATVRVLGCSGSMAQGCRTTAFLLGKSVLIDAGSGLGDLSIDEQVAIDHVLITHSHLDHVLGLPLLADSVIRRRRGQPPIQVHALPETLEVLRQHLFNNHLWPDFTRLPTLDAPVLEFCPVQVGDVLSLSGHPITVLPAAHSVPAVGYAVHGPSAAWAYTGDTGPNPGLWSALARLPVKQLVIEIAFPQAEQPLAAISGHHCPSTLAAELRHAPPGAEVWLTHIKPGEIEAVEADLRQHLPDVPVRLLYAGKRLQLA